MNIRFLKFITLLFVSALLVLNLSLVAFAKVNAVSPDSPLADAVADVDAVAYGVADNIANTEKNVIEGGNVGATVLPDTEKTVDDCLKLMNVVEMNKELYKSYISSRVNGYRDILACGIKTGNIPLWMIPYYIRYILEFIIAIAGVASVGGIIVGGYMYLFSGLDSEQKDKGKNALKNAVIGLVLSLSAWGIVNVFMALVSI